VYEQTTLQTKKQDKSKNPELEEFRKTHSETFMYFLEEYDKWKEMKEKC